MKLQRLNAEDTAHIFAIPETAFGEPVSVQGGTVRKAEGALLVKSRRFKLFTQGQDFLKISEGSGFIKWARGEFPFAAGDSILADGVGEYEVNGALEFIAVRK